MVWCPLLAGSGEVTPASTRVTRVELLRAEADVPFQVAGGAVLFTIPSVADYEVAAVHSA